MSSVEDRVISHRHVKILSQPKPLSDITTEPIPCYRFNKESNKKQIEDQNTNAFHDMHMVSS